MGFLQVCVCVSLQECSGPLISEAQEGPLRRPQPFLRSWNRDPALR